MAEVVTFADKETFEEKVNIPANKKGRAADWNELKSKINALVEEFNVLSDFTVANTSIPLFQAFEETQTSGTGETTLYEYTLPADRLLENGQQFKASFYGYRDENTVADASLELTLNGMTLLNYTMPQDGNYRIDVHCFRFSETQARILVHLFFDGVFFNYPYIQYQSGLDFSEDQDLILTGTSVNALNSVFFSMGSGIFIPNS